MTSPEVTDPRAARVRRLRALSQRSARAEQRVFLADGPQSVREALASAAVGEADVAQLWVTTDGSAAHPRLVAAAQTADVPVVTCTDQVMSALADTVSPQGVLAVCSFVDRPLPALVERHPVLVAMLANVRDPGNAGSVVRAADAAGAGAVVFSSGSVDPYNPKAVRACVGSLFHVPLCCDVDLASAVGELSAAGLRVLAADGSGALDLDQAVEDGTLARPTLWLFGNEAWGLPDEVLALADAVVRIPIHGRAESLNLATAAALCLYASARAQRG